MASGSESWRISQLRIDSPRPMHRTSPYPSNTSTRNRRTPIECSSSSARADSSMGILSEQATTCGTLPAELTELEDVLKKAEARLCGLPPVQSVVGGLKKCLGDLLINQQNRDDYEKPISELTDLIPQLWQPFIESNPQIIPQGILGAVTSIESRIQNIQNVRAPPSQTRATPPPTQEDRAKSVLSSFLEIKKQFGKLPTEISNWGERREQWTDSRLKDLLPTHEAYYNAALSTEVTKRAGCTENTRVDLLDDTQTWTQDKDGAKILWLNGMAGTGKTTIAYTMCKWLQGEGRLAANFFCSRNSLECRDVNKIVPTIAYQLGQRGRFPDSYRHRLCTAFERDADVARRDIGTQFEELISKPLSTIAEALPNNPVVVIDALDEGSDVHGAEVVLKMLLQHAENLPIKFFVTSRPEPAIVQRITEGGGAMRSIIWLHDIDELTVNADIKTYLSEALRSVQVTAAELHALAERAGCLFIFAATAVRYIIPERASVDHRQRLQTVLKLRPSQGNKSSKDIDDLYTVILSNALDDGVFEEDELLLRRQVLWTVACASGPLSIPAIAKMLSLPDAKKVEVAIQPLQSVVRISDTTNLVSTFHASFPNFLLSKERAGQFHCSEGLHNAYLAERCFQIMDRSLQFNICRLESSYMLDENVPYLQDRVDRVISAELFYACRYWGDHLAKCPPSPLFVDLLHSFMHHHLLFWVEVLNLKKHVGHGDGVLGQALSWLLREAHSTDLRDFISDARNFVSFFASHPVSLSTPHIYISALPFTPKKSHVWTTYWPRTQGLIRVESKALETRGKSALATWVVRKPVNSMSLSSDGKRVVLGLGSDQGRSWRSPSQEGEVSVKDASSGADIVGPLGGHTGQILAIKFSPDDTRIASGGTDKTICIWDASGGHLIAGPLLGHTNNVNSISFSLDGACIASCSDDRTIRLWDAYFGTQLGEPLDGHQDSVTSVVFSPDGKHLASGSRDRSVRAWDYKARRLTREPFKGHTKAVNSIAYSPDALRLVSGSNDKTVRVWDVSRGTLLAGPFTGHTNMISSVSFSPDGRLVVSGSWDTSIRVWEVASETLLAGPFEGHASEVNSVIFSADGTRVLSGSEDCTIRVWDARHMSSGTTKSPGRRGGVTFLVLSPDGIRLASGSRDNTIFVWDTLTGALIAGPLKGHTWVDGSLGFSPVGGRVVLGCCDCAQCRSDASRSASPAGQFEECTSTVNSIMLSANGNQTHFRPYDDTRWMWNPCSRSLVNVTFQGSNHGLRATSFSPNGSCIVASFYDAKVRMWDANDGTALWTSKAHINDVNCVAFSPDGARVASGSMDKAILVLDTRDGAALHGPFIGTDMVNSLAFSLDGSHLVSGSNDGRVRVWDLRCDTMVFALKAHTQPVRSVLFSGARIISGSDDGTIRFWDLTAATQPDATFHDGLKMQDDGWLTNSGEERLLWVPPDLREDFELPSPANPLIIGRSYPTRVVNSKLFLGDQWHQCYILSQ